jgi:tripartite-type tricarboxylate transporter receptor subunit TctC
VRLLAAAQPRRSAQAPEVPTMAEAGFSGLEIEVWFGLLGPAGMPAAQVQRLNGELNAMLEDPAVRQVLARQELEAKGGPVEAFAALVNGERARWARVINEAGITAE